jgi:hypothetical protein
MNTPDANGIAQRYGVNVLGDAFDTAITAKSEGNGHAALDPFADQDALDWPLPQGNRIARNLPKQITLRWHGESDQDADRSWLVKHLLPESGSGLVSGQWGTAKTFVVLDLAAAVTGGTFAGRRVARRGGVFFLAAEGAFEIPIRLKGLVVSGKAGAGVGRLPFVWSEQCPRLLDGVRSRGWRPWPRRPADAWPKSGNCRWRSSLSTPCRRRPASRTKAVPPRAKQP